MHTKFAQLFLKAGYLACCVQFSSLCLLHRRGQGKGPIKTAGQECAEEGLLPQQASRSGFALFKEQMDPRT